MTLTKVAWIEQRTGSSSSDVRPVETSVQDIEAEIAVQHQVGLRRRGGREPQRVGGLFPSSHSGVGTMHLNKVVDIIVEIAVLKFLVQLREPIPGLDDSVGF